MTSMQHRLTDEAKAAMIANLQLEGKNEPFLHSFQPSPWLIPLPVNARKEKLRAQCEAQCASLQSRLERRVNRIPLTKRQALLLELYAVAGPSSSAPQATIAPAKVVKSTTQKKTAASRGRVAAAPATSKRVATAAAAATTTTSTTRATRAAARTREVLSPKPNGTRPKSAASTKKPR